ncbi:alpha/beta fold hydrolase [Azospirillum picis]|uniref:Pimeloyl-ACP methyl ester carboxylesterase n=1 Tax=Azospirillum picis TaxID=488438 RepID=A0ABU0MG02_9PROT|nr:alpha/beta fold hydrolase [Azospirillum picis]MBP2298595.1 pimeloyl-ACP methyl ester carboxylesterase [Azospirillum picis]MDQ0532356.1 pimeloyl-ACP methyl ester carboxylesterase [Azospirillum picis]
MPADRSALVLLPGMPLDAALWDHQVRHLADVADPRVVELAGCDSIAAMADLVLSEAPGRFAVAGLSMGGYVALEILRRAPERVERAALLDTNARPDSTEATANRREAVALARQGRFGQVIRAALPRLIHPDRLSDESFVRAVLAQMERVGIDGYAREQEAIINRPDSRPGLPAIRCPVLVACGRQDALTPPALHEEMADAIPGARLVLIEDCGHLAAMEQPQAVTALMRDWLLRR